MIYDVIIAGGGPAGMTAALYALRNGKSALVIEQSGFGGQITHSPKVENYPGTLSMSGNEFADSLMDQIMTQGADIEIDKVVRIEDDGAVKRVLTEEGGVFEGKTVIIATGVKHRMLGLEGEYDLVGEGISFCAVCDGDFYKDKEVCVIGGGNSALQEAVLLSEKCTHLTVLQDLPYYTGEQRLVDVLFSKDNVKGITGVKVTRLITGDDPMDINRFKGVEIEYTENGKKEEIFCDGIFVAIGLIPENDPFKELADLNNYGYFNSDEQCMTKTPGIYVAGDCRSKQVRQLTTAAADGAVAALAACRYINEI